MSAIELDGVQTSADRTPLAIEWIEAMRRDGFVFVARGDPDDLDSYACLKDRGEGDDTNRLLGIFAGEA